MDLVNINVSQTCCWKKFKANNGQMKLNSLEAALSNKMEKNGYSIKKTKRYRFTEWKFDGKLGHELYDHKYDKEELNNLALY